MSKAYFTDTLRSVKKTLSRFISIVAIVALGSGLFVGFNAVYPDMKDTAVNYYEKYNLMDIRLQSYIGIYEEDLNEIKELSEVKAVQGEKFVDGFVQTPTSDGTDYEGIVDIDGSELTVKVLGFDVTKATAFENGENDINYINRLKLVEGRYPENTHECVVTCSSLSTPSEFVIGNKIKVVGDGEEISYYLQENEFEIVGIVLSPYWVSYERGTTTAGSGKLGDFIYVSNDCFKANVSYYSEVYVTLNNPSGFEAYTDEYEAYVDSVQEKILSMSDSIAKRRGALLEVGLSDKIIKAGTEIKSAESVINTKLDEGRKQLEELYELEKTGAKQLEEAQAEMDKQLQAAQSEIDSGSDEYLAAVNEYNSKAQAVADGNVELSKRKAEYEQNRSLADDANDQLESANLQLTLAAAEITAAKKLIETTQTTLETLKNNQDVAMGDLDLAAMADRLEETNPELAKTLRALASLTAQGTAAEAIAEVELLLDQYTTELAVAEENYAASKAEYNTKKAEYDSADAQLKVAEAQLKSAETQLSSAERELSSYKTKLDESGLTLKLGSIEAQTKYNNAQITLATKTQQFQNIKALILSAEEQLKTAEAEAEAKLGSAKTEYNKAISLYENIKNGAFWFVYDRNDSPGYTGYGEVSENMQKLAYIFPTFFFIVSTLICLTTMTRMVEEERTQLGTLKALGYSNKMIVGKYLSYAGVASLIGVIIGVSAGFYVFPKAIFSAWQIMYDIPDLVIHYIPLYIVLGVILSVGTTMGAAYFACRSELVSVPAVLMRPKPPKEGKRVFLENIKFIWSRMNFTSKVTARNLFRNKKRFFVTVIGIAGCTALMLAGFGLQNSVSSVIENQYGESGVAKYDLQVVLKNGEQSYADSEIVSEINSLNGVESSMLGYLKVCTGFSDRTDEELEVDVLVSESPAELPNFVKLAHKGKTVTLTDEGAVITSKFADKTDTKIGDTVKVKWLEGSKSVEYEVKVTGIVDNYTFHYVYMTPVCFANMTGTAPTYNYLFCNTPDGFSADDKNALETQINNLDGINGTVYTSVVIDNFNNIINSLNIVTVILIFAAMALAFIVLYNLNNINVNERIRELATLKVLGFYDGEVSAYIYRENVILTLIGIILGLFLGVFLNMAIIGVIDIDTVTFSTEVGIVSFVIAAVLTLVFAFIVNLAMHFKLKKISMVESLKSVE